MMRPRFSVLLLPVASLLPAIAIATLGTACDNKPKGELAPASSSLAITQPTTASTRAFSVDRATSKVDFSMDAELEKISGHAPGALEGELFLDPADVTKSSALVKLDLDQLSIYQRKRAKADGEFSPEAKNEKQNADMHVWFEIASDAPPDVREKNRWVEFRVAKVANPSLSDLNQASGSERKFDATVSGDFRLHGRSKERTAKIEVVVHYTGDAPDRVHVKTLEPLAVPLEEYDVGPRSAFSKLADKTLATLGAKVAKVAMVSLEFDAKPRATAH